MWGIEYIESYANKYVMHFIKLVKSLVCVRQFGFGLLWKKSFTTEAVQSRGL